MQRRRRKIHDPAAVWLRQCKAADPQRFREVARRHPVLSTWQIDQRKANEVSTEQVTPGRDETPRPVVAHQVFRDWQRAKAAI